LKDPKHDYDCIRTDEAEYSIIIGDSLRSVDVWKAAHPGRPFVGLRVGEDGVWVYCETESEGVHVPDAAVVEIEASRLATAFNGVELGGVFVAPAPTIAAAKRLVGDILTILRRHG
jgi:hypothetical protein